VPYLKEEWLKAHPNKKANIARISHSLVMKEWRPDVDQLVVREDTKLPQTAAALIKICWGDYPESRPNFDDSTEYVKHPLRAGVMGVELETADKLSKFLYPDGLDTTNRTAAGTRTDTQNGGNGKRRTSVSLALKIRDRERSERSRKGEGEGGGGGLAPLVSGLSKD
jgi:hypothetical protein